MNASVSKFLIYALFVSACLSSRALKQEAPQLPAGREVVLSEISLEVPLGKTGSWIELYNRSSEEVNIGGLQVEGAGKVLAQFPSQFTVPARALVLLHFKDEVERDWKIDRERRPSVTIFLLRVLIAESSGELFQ